MSEIPDDPRPFRILHLGQLCKAHQERLFQHRPDSGTVRIQRPVLRDHSGVSTFTELTISLILI